MKSRLAGAGLKVAKLFENRLTALPGEIWELLRVDADPFFAMTGSAALPDHFGAALRNGLREHPACLARPGDVRYRRHRGGGRIGPSFGIPECLSHGR